MNTIYSRKRLSALVIAAVLQAVASAHAAVIPVVNTNDNSAGSLRQAILDASSGDTIRFQIPTTDPNYNATTGIITILLTSNSLQNGELKIAKNLTIDGSGQKIVVQRSGGAALYRIFHVTAGTVEIANLTITTGSAYMSSGGGIFNESVLLVRNCTLRGNGGDGNGGAIYNTGTLMVSNCTMTGNIGNFTGSAIYNTASLTLNNSTITLNNSQLNSSSPPPGAAVYNASGATARVRNSIIVGNTTSSASASKDVVGSFSSEGYNLIGTTTGSAGFGVTGDQLGATAAQVNLGPLQDNGGFTKTMAPKPGSTALDQGHNGGLTTDQRGAPRPVHRTTATNVPGDFSDIGAVEIGLSQFPNSAANLTVTNTDEHNEHDCRTDSCTLAEAIEIGSFITTNGGLGPVTIRFAPGISGVISNTTVPGGLAISASLTIIGPGARVLAISGGNVARVFAISPGAVVNLSGLTITKGNSSGIGGGIFSDHGNLTLTECTVSGNTGYSGGGIFSRGSSSGSATLTMMNSTVSGNVASGGLGEGGGLYNEGLNGGTATMNLTNCTISGNMAPNIPATAAFQSFGRSGTTNATLTNCTLSSNAISNDTAVLSIANTILNGATISNAGTITSKGHNLSSDAAGGDGTNAPGGFLNAAGDKRNTNPVLDTLKNNGGTTDTLALLSNSPARDAGDNNFAPTTDERGYARFGVSDMGAFELNGVPPTLANVSTRLPVGIGDNALFTGFIVTGTQPKKVIVRALGPSIGVSGALANPTLELYSGSTFLEANDNWVDSPNRQAIVDTTVQPPNSLESAIVRSVLPGNYTAIERGVNNDTGIGVIDVYDLDISASSKLANVSARGLVQNGDNLLFAGTIVVGQASQKVIIRALGPSTGVSGAMADPTLELHDGNGAILEANDNWGDSPNKQAIIDSTIPPPNSLESAIVRTLTPGNYTAIVRSANNNAGIAVVEIYALN